MESLTTILNEIVSYAGAAPILQLKPHLRLRNDLGLDSLQLAVLTVKIEAEFGVDVFADGIVTTVGEIEEKIRKHQAGQK